MKTLERIDISADLTPAFFKDKKFKKGSVLVFDFEGSRNEYKIVRLNRRKKVCEVVETQLYTEEQMRNIWEDVRHG